MQNVMRVSPDGLDDNQRRAAGILAKNLHSILLRIKKTTPDFFAKTMRTLDCPTFQLERFEQCSLHCKLSGFAFLICRSTKISIRSEIDN